MVCTTVKLIILLNFSVSLLSVGRIWVSKVWVQGDLRKKIEKEGEEGSKVGDVRRNGVGPETLDPEPDRFGTSESGMGPSEPLR